MNTEDILKIFEPIKEDIKDIRDKIFDSAEDDLPKKVDLRKYAGEIENQRGTSSCVANATVSALELITEEKNKKINLSRLFLYWNLRNYQKLLAGKDEGGFIRDAFKAAKEFGICTEDMWKFDIYKVNQEPPKQAYRKALENRVVRYERIKTKQNDTIQKIKTALYQGYPVVFGMKISIDFLKKGRKKTFDEQIKYTGTGEDKEHKSIGGHAMNIVGYNDEKGYFIVENSWGKEWGADGYCAIKYNVVEKDANDIWVCTKFIIGTKDNLNFFDKVSLFWYDITRKINDKLLMFLIVLAIGIGAFFIGI